MSLHTTPTAPLAASDKPGTDTVEPVRHARLFRNGANQAVRIPKEFELPPGEVTVRKVGNTLVIEPVKPVFEKGSPAAMMAMLEEMARLGPIDEEFPDVDAGLLPLDEIDLGEA
jgi:antitoxin VapB